MLDIKFIRENKDIVEAGARKKHITVDLNRLIEVDDKRRALQAQIDQKRAEQNVASNAMAFAKDVERKEIIARMQTLKETLKLEEESLAEILKEWRGLMVQVPNVPDISVPEGEGDANNQEVRRWSSDSGFDGKATEIPCLPAGRDFEPKNHVDLMLAHDMAEFERGTKVAGFRGYFLKNDGARLGWALERFVEDHFT